tara:strand:+ start:1849 stop:2316 length:468 start_codon:yes stop_codon:yes gene_type:complete
MAVELIQAKRATIHAILNLDSSSGPNLHAPMINIARHIRKTSKCNLGHALSAVLRLKDDPAFQSDMVNGTLGINLLDRDCIVDPRTKVHLRRLIGTAIRSHKSNIFLIPSRKRVRFTLETKVRVKDTNKIDWYLDYENRIGKPIRSFAELERDLA